MKSLRAFIWLSVHSATENLERYAAVMFYTTGELPMSDAQKRALLNFVRSGRGSRHPESAEAEAWQKSRWRFGPLGPR
ncbi:hypothetical protein [Bradyrhizobium sp. 139]|uniref:hypothetical protein n=1 Tax=Bradyrhizobium sp. 139 TaxID=2782616 RepID=UPI001FFAE8E9|nr:hypothetical protein [Bradyrhizobium sp. 139]